MSDEKKIDKFEEICQNVFKRYPVMTVAKLQEVIDNAALDTQSAVILENEGRNQEAAKAAAFAIAKAPLTVAAGVALGVTQIIVGGVVLPVALVRMALEKTEVKAEAPAAPAAPSAE